MLVLSRRVGERIIISRNGEQLLELDLLEVFGHKARLGLTAPADVVIQRAELTEEPQPEGAPA